MRLIDSTPEFVAGVYERMEANLAVVRRRLARPLTHSEKALLSHLSDPEGQELEAGRSYMLLHPDRVALQDVTGQMALLQFMQSGQDAVAAPTTMHCDHLIQANLGAREDTDVAIKGNREVFDFLRSASNKYGIGFWAPGAGIIHQVVLENYAFPGGMMIGTDSHSTNAGGLGMFAVGVGGADAVDVMAGFPWEVLYPGTIGVRLTGELSGWASPKDVILSICGALTVQGGTNRVIEYFGPGVSSISCTGKATITNMGAELGATTSIFPYDPRMEIYLRATGRGPLADLANRNRHLLTPDPEVEADPGRFFDTVVEIDLSRLEPHVVGPHTPDLARPVSRLAQAVDKEGYAARISVALIGSCTNSSYEDIARTADVARQAAAHGAKAKSRLLVTPGSEQVRATIERDGQIQELEDVGALVLANACGPCIGQWSRTDIRSGEPNSILTSFNRNFPRRNDGNAETMAFIASPEIVMAFALAGTLSFNPMTDTLEGADGAPFRLEPPSPAPEVPVDGFASSGAGYFAPAEDPSTVELVVNPRSQRLQALEPFPAWDGEDILEMQVLIKVRGKCTTDHISPAGPWLSLRGHLDRISDNAFLGAENAFTGEAGKGLNQVTAEAGRGYAATARDYKARGLRWVAIGDQNYGEGSSREHAAMTPRHLGCAVVIVRSFARIHETNLKKQGILPVTFADPADYDRVQETDRVSVVGLRELAPGQPLSGYLHHADGTRDHVQLLHTMNAEHIGWFQAGAALNVLRLRASA